MEKEKFIAKDFHVSKKVENFWYHYKWHTIVSLILVFVLLFLCLQTCDRNKYSYFAMYAGPKGISANQGLLMATALEQMAEEAGLESGKKASLAVYNIYEKDTTGQSSQNFQVFNDDIVTGKSIILALSPTLYTHLLEKNGGIVVLDEYLPSEGGDNITFVDDSHRGIKLSSLPLYQKEGWKDLPEDTVLCLRSPISLANIFNSEKAQKNYIIYETLFRYILAEPLAEEA